MSATEITTSIVEELRNVYCNRFPEREMVDPPYNFIEFMMYTFTISREEALELNYTANKERGRFNVKF